MKKKRAKNNHLLAETRPEGRVRDEEKLYRLYKLVAEEQVNVNSGLPVTYQRMQEIWGFSAKSKASATNYLPQMEARGYMRSILRKREGYRPTRKWFANVDAPYNPLTHKLLPEKKEQK